MTINQSTNQQELTASTKLVGLIGWPVGHSISPIMHNAAFARLEMDWRYVGLPVSPQPPARIGEAVLGIRALGLRGANVTVPHKQAVMPFLDGLTPAARAIGAVNTILVVDDELIGDNTDAPGFIADLHEQGVAVTGMSALVLGAGGSARAVVYGLADTGAKAITVLNRSVERAEILVEEMAEFFPACIFRTGRLPDDIPDANADADLVVNCTSVGMTPYAEEMPWDEETEFAPEQVVYDLIYRPAVTRLLQMAAADGAVTIGGLGMLIWQGALAFERMTGQEAPVDLMRAAALRAMDGG